MNKLEQDILQVLAGDSRIPPEKIAVMLGKDAATVTKAIRDMESSGVIVKYNVLVNDERVGNETVLAWIEVKVTPQRSLGFDAIAEQIYQFEEVKDLYLMSGGFDLAVLVEGRSLKEVAMFVSEKLSVMDTVTGTSTHFILKKYKVGGVQLSKKQDGRRMPVFA